MLVLDLFVDQTQHEYTMSVPDYKKLNSCHNGDGKMDLKLVKYLRTNACKSAIKFTVRSNTYK